MPSSILSFKKGKIGSWFSNKLVLSRKNADVTVEVANELPDVGGCSPLIENMDANNPRTKHMLLPKPNVVLLDDCSQQILSSDQASAIARIDDQSMNSCASEHYGSECSLTDSVLAATSHMATIRSLLVSHISETHDTSTIQKPTAGPAAATMASIARRSLATSAASAAGHRSSKDRTVQALLADQMQLLDLVQTLIADHRTSLLEQQRLQQQLVAAETALHKEQLNKERAIALAEVRAEQVSHVQADLAVASAAVQKLHSVKTISSQRIRLPPSAKNIAALSSPMSERSGLVSPVQLTPSKRASAIIGRLAPESSWQDQHAIVGPAPASYKHQPLANGAMAIRPLAHNSSDKRLRTADNRDSSARQTAGARGSRGPSGRSSSSHRASRTSTAATEPTMSTAAASSTQHSSRQRRLLTESNRGSTWNSSQPEAAGLKFNVSLQQSNRGVTMQQEVPLDAGGSIQPPEQQHQEAVIAAAAQHAAALAVAPSAASKLAQVHASALELVLLQRLNSSSKVDLPTGQQQQLQRASIETDGSALSMAWAAGDTDAVAAAAGLTKQQLKQLLHRPWLLRSSQEEVASVLLQQPGHQGAAAAASPLSSTTRQQSHKTEYFSTAATADSESMQDAGPDSDGSSLTTGDTQQSAHDNSSDADDGESLTEQEQHDTAAAVATSWRANAQAPQQQQLQHSRAGASGSREAGMHASNGSSWPAVKLSDMAQGDDIATADMQQAVANPSHKQRAAARVRPNQQPVQMSASLESAATLSVAMQQGSTSHGSQSSCLTGGGSACGGDGCRYLVYEAAADANAIPLRQQQQQRQQRGQVDLSCDLVQQASMEGLESALCRRKLHLPAAATTAGDQQQQQQGERPQRRISSAGSQQQQQQLSPRRSAASITRGGQSPRPAYGADSEDGEVSTTSDFACASIASVATGCSGYSTIDFVPKSHTKARPAGVPQLTLPVTAFGSSTADTQQQQQVLPSPRERARLMAQQSDMAPLKAQRGTPRGSTAAVASKVAAAAGVERAGGSFTGLGTGVNCVRTVAGGALSALGIRSHSFAAGSSTAAAAAALGAEAESSSATVASSVGSGSSKVAAKAAAGSSAISRVSSVGTAAGAAAAGAPYWGSSAGSYPVSEEHSRLLTPGSEPSGLQIYAPAAAAAAIPRAAVPYTATTTHDDPAADDSTVHQQRHQPAQLPLHLQATVAAAAAGELAAAAAGLATAATQAVAGLTPRTAAGTFMGSRPPNVYKSVSTQFAMYSPLRGNLHVLGHNRQGSPGTSAAVDVDECDNNTIAGLGAPAAAAAAGQHGQIYTEVSNAASEWHYQHLLGTVPEEEGIVYDSLTAGGNVELGAAAVEGVSLHISAEPSRESSTVSLHRKASHSSSYSASPSPELVYATSLPTLEDFQRMVLLEQQQREHEQQQQEERQQHQHRQIQQQQQQREIQMQQQLELEQPQQEQQQQRRERERREIQQQQSPKQEMSLDVIDRGPVYNPGVTSPTAMAEAPSSIARPARGGGNSSHQQNRVSLQHSRSGATAAAATAVTVDEQQQQQQQQQHFGAMGPLTASSPTRKRSSTVLSSSNAGLNGGSALSSQQQQQQQQHSRPGTEPRYTASTSSSRARTSTETAAVARLEAAAAAVQARVVAVASRSSSRRQQQQQEEVSEVLITHAALSLSCTPADAEQQQQQQQNECAAVNGSSGGQRVRRRWNQQQEEAAQANSGEQQLPSPIVATAAGACAGADGNEAPVAQPPKRQHTCSNRSRGGSRSRQRQQQPGCELEQQRQHCKRSSSKGSSRTSSGAGHQPAIPHSAAAASTRGSGCIGLPDYRDAMVTSYHNPMLMLEGLDEEGEQAMINAGLVPGLTPQGLAAGASWAGYKGSTLATQSSGDLLPAASQSQASFDNYQGVDVAAVPAHVTPLGKERSSVAVGQSAAAADQNGGQLHWNPLYDPNAWNGSPVLGY